MKRLASLVTHPLALGAGAVGALGGGALALSKFLEGQKEQKYNELMGYADPLPQQPSVYTELMPPQNYVPDPQGGQYNPMPGEFITGNNTPVQMIEQAIPPMNELEPGKIYVEQQPELQGGLLSYQDKLKQELKLVKALEKARKEQQLLEAELRMYSNGY